MNVLFCCDPNDRRRVDPDFAEQEAAALEAGLGVDLVSYEELVGGDAARSVECVSVKGPAVYRGWMLKPAAYSELHAALAGVRVELLTSPEAYGHCHELPGWYDNFVPDTPRSAWLEAGPNVGLEDYLGVLRDLGAKSVIVKDFVKSWKHQWLEACFIPDADDLENAAKVVRTFLKYQGADLNGGVVFREFLNFESAGAHPLSGMPMSREYRLFFALGKLVAAIPYWPEADYSGQSPPMQQFERLVPRVGSPFFSMDVAREVSGEWRVVELGDGQVSGLLGASPNHFYRSLAAILG